MRLDRFGSWQLPLVALGGIIPCFAGCAKGGDIDGDVADGEVFRVVDDDVTDGGNASDAGRILDERSTSDAAADLPTPDATDAGTLPPDPETASPLCSDGPICVRRFHPLTAGEERLRVAYGHPFVSVISDRVEYSSVDVSAHVFVLFIAEPRASVPGGLLRLELRRDGIVVATRELAEVATPKLELLIDLQKLSAGDYSLHAQIERAGRVEVETTGEFRKVASSMQSTAGWPPEGIPLVVHDQAEIPNGRAPITTAIPLSDGLLRDPSAVTLTENGIPIPFQATPRGHWSTEGHISWLGIDFVARYDNGLPRDYRLVRGSMPTLAAASPQIAVRDEDDFIQIDTGVARFNIRKDQFTGIDSGFYDLDRDGQYSQDERVVSTGGGPYLVDERGVLFAAAYDSEVQVEIVEVGPIKATVVARGAYRDHFGEPLCNFVTELTAFAGEPDMRVRHRTILTYDTRTSRRIQDLGWQIPSAFPPTEWAFGAEDGTASGAMPSPGASTFLHQERHDAYRIVRDRVQTHAGTRSTGWGSLSGESLSMSVMLRDIYQKYPKELEVANDPRDPFVATSFSPYLALHFWPRHGRDTFTEVEETARQNLSHLLYLHEGETLDFNVPNSLVAELTRLDTEPGPDYNWDPVNQIGTAQNGNAQGAAIGNEFVIRLHSAAESHNDLDAQARLHQRAPHAIADPAWFAETGVEGSLAGYDPHRFPEMEQLLTLGVGAYLDYYVDALSEYGMWVYLNMHNGFDPELEAPVLHRLSQLSHYHNVTALWLFYLRSGDPRVYQMARAHSEYLTDIGVIHHDKAGSTVDASRAGTMYHVNGFLPWADGEALASGHHVDFSAPLLQWLVTGDSFARDTIDQWRDNLHDKGLRGDLAPEAPCESFASVNYIRNVVTTIGDVVHVYQTTRDPQLLITVHEVTRRFLQIPLECTQIPSDHPTWGAQWFWHYWNLTRDPRVVAQLKSYADAGYGDESSSLMAFLYARTGDEAYIDRALASFDDLSHSIYLNEGDRYHGFSPHIVAAPRIRHLHSAPFFMRALIDAGRVGDRGTSRSAYPFHPSVDTPGQYAPRAPSGFANAAQTVLIDAPTAGDFLLTLDPLSTPGGSFRVYAPPNPPPPQTWNTIPEFLIGDSFTVQDTYPLQVDVPASESGTYRVDCLGLCNFGAPLTSFPEVGVLRRYRYWNGAIEPFVAWTTGRTDFYMRPSDPTDSVTLAFRAMRGNSQVAPRSASPAFVRVVDDAGKVHVEGTVFYYGERNELEVTLDPSTAPLPWHLWTVSRDGPEIQIQAGAPELLLSTTP